MILVWLNDIVIIQKQMKENNKTENCSTTTWKGVLLAAKNYDCHGLKGGF